MGHFIEYYAEWPNIDSKAVVPMSYFTYIELNISGAV